MATDKYFLSWDDAALAGPEQAGGKGYNLGRLARYGFPVPAGGVLTAAFYQEFTQQHGLLEKISQLAASITLETLDSEETAEQLAEIRRLMQEQELPKGLALELKQELSQQGLLERPVAVRSSATAEDSTRYSFAGIHQSFLNLSGWEAIVRAIKECYASLWTLTAVAYRRRQGLPDSEVLPALVIMTMVPARAAGIAFTCNPLNGRWDDLVINAAFGLGEAVVGGQVEPDQYHLDPKGTFPEISAKRIGYKKQKTVLNQAGGTDLVPCDAGESQAQVLSDAEIRRLGLLILRVLDSLGQGQEPQDIEWAYDGQQFWLLQARPVTGLPRYTYPALQGQPEYWSNANFRDVVPYVVNPLTWGTLRNLLDIMMTTPLRVSGWRYLPGIRYARLINGRPYFNLSVIQWEYYEAIGIATAQTNELLGGHQPEIEIPASYRKNWRLKLNWVKHNLQLLSAINRTRREIQQVFQRNREVCRDWLERCQQPLWGEEGVRLLDEMNRHLAWLCSKIALMNSAAAAPMSFLQRLLTPFLKERTGVVINALLIGQGQVVSAQHGYRLLELTVLAGQEEEVRAFLTSGRFTSRSWAEALPETSRFKAEFRSFLEEFGHRATYETNIACPRWREDPSYLLEYIGSMIGHADPAGLRAQQQAKREQAWQEVRNRVPSLLLPLVKKLVNAASQGGELRELAKSELIRCVEPARMLALAWGRRLQQAGVLAEVDDVFQCSWAELLYLLSGEWDGSGLKALIADRKASQQYYETLPVPDLVEGERPRFRQQTDAVGAKVLIGMGVAPGQAQGPACPVSHLSQSSQLVPGGILVAPATDPGWTPLFLKAAGVVMETGGLLSHGAIVAREYGIPCVVNIPGVLERVNHGHMLTVDGDEGKVYL